MNMQETELRQLLRSNDWGLLIRERKGVKRNSYYLFAQKRDGEQINQVYITTRRLLPLITQEEVLEKIGVAS